MTVSRAQEGDLFLEEGGVEELDQEAEVTGVPPEESGPAAFTGAERIFRAGKDRVQFSVANIFTSRDIWRGIDWFWDNDPAYLLGGEMIVDLTPYNEQEKRDIWELRWHNMVAGAYSLTAGHENVDRWKVMTALENRIFKYIDFDIGYEHYGLPPFDDHDRDFDELLLRAGFNSVPTFKSLSLPGYKGPITSIPFSVHYGGYYNSSSKSFSWTTDKYGFHGYPSGDWWWHQIEFGLILPFPDVIPENTHKVVRALKFDSVIWTIDREGLPGQPSGFQDAEFGLALPLFFDFGEEFALNNHLWGTFGKAQLIVNPYARYALKAKNFDSGTGTWYNHDEVYGGVALVVAF
jgi:hypothetical protein